MIRELFILTIFVSIFIKGVKVTEAASESVLSANSYTFIETTTEYGVITSTNNEIYFSNENVIEGTTIKDESSSTDLNEFRATEDCIDGLEFTINRTEENLAVSLKTNKTCNVNYYIHLTKAYNDNRHDVPYFRRDNKIFHKIKKKLFQCSAYNISIEVGFTPVYERIIWTLPGQVDLLLISAKNNKTKVSWTPSTYPNCSDYYIYVDDKSYRKTSTTSYIFDGNLYCTKFGIEIVGKDNNVGKRVTAIVPGPVLNLSIIETATSLTINWNPPEIDDCVTGYKIEIDTTSTEIEDTNFGLNNLESCTTYTVSVSAKSGTIYGEPVTQTARTGTPAQISSVSNLALTVVENVLHVTWTPPAQQGACIQNYRVLLWDDNSVTEDFKTTATYYDFSPLIGCMTYNVQITPIVSEAQEGQLAINNSKIDPLPTDPPNLRTLDIDKTWAEMTFTLESFADNRCTITNVSVHCDGVNNENYPWVIGSQDAFVDYTDSTSRPVAKVSVTGLSEFTNYSCVAVVENEGGISENSEPIEFRTLAEVPSIPQNLQLATITDTSFMVTWDQPAKVPGILENYKIETITNRNLHYLPEECSVPNNTNINFTEADVTFHDVIDAFPNFEYILEVSAMTVDYGPSATLYVYTNPSASEVPRSVDYDFRNILGENYDVTLLLSWVLPCSTNGNLIHFEIETLGFSLDDPLESHHQVVNVPPNDPIENETYYLEIPDIKGFFNYTVEIKAIVSNLTETIEGEPYEITFLSPDGYPSAPINVRSSEATEYSVLINWDEPISKNGELQKYNVTIVSIGPLHNVANGCGIHELHQTYEIPATTNQFRFNEGFPNYNYTVIVRASTSVDFGIESEIISFQTLNSASEIPRNVEYDFKNILGEVYDVTLLLNWSLPCNTNGKLSLFQVDILGFSLEDPSEEQILLENVAPNDPIEEETYYWEVSDIKGFFNYTVKLKAIISEEIESEPYEITFLSPDGYPSAPVNVRTSESTANSVLVSWEEPLSKNGELRQYNVSIVSIGPLHNVEDGCEIHKLYETYMVTADENEFEFADGVSNYNYTVIIRASTSVGFGVDSEIISFQTLPTDPDMVRNLNTEIHFTENELYNADVTISFLKPCNMNGIFQQYNVTLMGTRAGFDDVILETTIREYANNTVTFNLKPQYNYTGGIQVLNAQFISETYEIEQFTAPAGVPADDISELQAPIADGSQTASFLLSSDLFSTTNGDILYYALILTRGEKQDDETYGFWDGTTWPSIGVWSDEDAITYQTNEEFWNPFVTKIIENFTYVIGVENCTEVTGFCNGPLTPETEYEFRVRGFTYNGFRDTMSVGFITPADLDNSLNWALIFGLTFGILAFMLVTIFIFILWRKKKKDQFENIETKDTPPFLPLPITTKEFPEHYDDYKEHLHKFKDEFTLLSKISAENAPLTTIGISEENKKKNRYINILPYDDTRVILADNNANYTDYINASFIKGYSGSVEYIATQGPLESTVVDFWRMVMQENISVIVMVAQFVEQTKQKCHKYFPDNHEIMEIGDGIEIKCSNELNFGVYIVRNLLVQRGLTQWSITHLQFMDWPDFGCPNGTQTMLQFCKVMRQHIERDKNKTIIHCSAGVGRTGTLIAIDILLQTIENNGDINVFETVLKLRKQRSHMVQTEKQYVYIHSCVKDNILNPIKFNEKKSEPIYENIDLLQAELNGKAIAESAL